MTTTDHKAELKRLRKDSEDLRFLIKRLPGLKTIEQMEQDAYLLDSLSPEAAEFQRRLAARLDEMRARFHGPRKGYKRDPQLI